MREKKILYVTCGIDYRERKKKSNVIELIGLLPAAVGIAVQRERNFFLGN